MAVKKKTVFMCTECGFDSPKWQGKCPGCGQWNTMVEQTVREDTRAAGGAHVVKSTRNPVRLSEISGDERDRSPSGIGELDRVLGGGMVRGSLILVSGEPGIGKSTLLLQSCAALTERSKVLYVTGEESLPQIKMRASRLGIDGGELFLLAETELDTILSAIDKLSPEVVIIDSVQTVFNSALPSSPGSVTQVRDCTMAFMNRAKTADTCVILVGHVNKDGGIAGPKVLEHMVDTVLNFEGDRHISYRMLRAVKNRFGSTNEIGMFEMTDRGLLEVPNPSAALLSGRPENSSGSCVVATLEGTRPMLVEVQGLVTKSAYGAARRTAAGIDYNRAVLLLAIMEKRAGFMLGSFDAYINVVGGLFLDEPAIDLAVAVAVASSYLDKPVKGGLAVFGEIGLAGEVRAVSGARQRVGELKRLGFSSCVLPVACRGDLGDMNGIDLIYSDELTHAIKLSLT